MPNSKHMKYVWLIFLLALILGALSSYLTIIPPRDTAQRYAPMAEALARGDWLYAVHPRIPPLHPVLSGCLVWLFGISGFAACQIMSVLYYALSVFPFYGLFRRVWGERAALVGCLAAALCSHVARLTGGGLRDTAKMLAFALAGYALVRIYQERSRLAGYLYLALGCSLMINTRSDLVLCAALIFGAVFFLEIVKRFFPWRTLLAFAALLILISPTLYVNYRFVGYPAPDTRFAIMMDKMAKYLKLDIRGRNALVDLDKRKDYRENRMMQLTTYDPLDVEGKDEKVSFRTALVRSIPEFLGDFFKGFYPYFLIPALLAVFFRLRRKEWKPEETIVLALLVGHALVIVFQILAYNHRLYVSRRYLLPVSPLACGWAALTVLWVWDKFTKYRKLVALVLIVLAVFLVCDSIAPVIKQHSASSKHAAEAASTLEIANYIKKDYRGKKYSPRKLDVNFYFANSNPKIYCIYHMTEVLYFCGGSFAGDFQEADYVLIRPAARKYAELDNFKLIKEFDGYKTKYELWRKNPPFLRPVKKQEK